MRQILSLLALLCLEKSLNAQYIYTIKADSVKITNTCDTAELIIENHTQTVPGFLFNKGRGRTEFRRGLLKLNDSIYIVGGDSLRMNPWLQGGNRFGTTGVFGTMDNNPIDFYTNNTKRGRLANNGNLLIGIDDDNGYKLAVAGTTYSQFFTNSTTPLGAPGDGALRLRWGGGTGCYIDFYNQGNTNKRGFIQSPSDSRPLYIYDQVGITFGAVPYVAIGTEVPQNAKLSITSPLNSTMDVFNACITPSTGYQSALTVKASGNTVLGDYFFDNHNRLQVLGSAYVRDTLRLPNLVSQTDMSTYKPVVADASGNVYKMAAWNTPSTRKSVTVSASSYIVSSDIDVVFVNYTGGTATIALPTGTLDREITIKNLNTTNTVALSGLDASESNTIATRGAITVKYTGSSWVGISKY